MVRDGVDVITLNFSSSSSNNNNNNNNNNKGTKSRNYLKSYWALQTYFGDY
jgi:hypothetical protein